MAKVLLSLDVLGFTLVFVDEFSVNDYTNPRYNWAKIGTDAVVTEIKYNE